MKRLKTEIRKEQLIRGVLNVISRDGMNHLSIARVSKEIGLVPSALYRHFSSKDEMLDAVLEYIQDRIRSNIHDVSEETDDAVERLHRFLLRQLKLIKESPAIPTVVFTQAFFSERAERRKKMFQLVTEAMQRLAFIVQIGQKDGEIRTDIEAQTIVLMLIGIFQPAALLYQLSDGKHDPLKHGKKVWKLFRSMIVPVQK